MVNYVLYVNEKRFAQYTSKAQCNKTLAALAKRLKKPKSAFKIRKLLPPKYKVGDMVYSYQNKTTKRPIRRVVKSDDPEYAHAYILTLIDENTGGARSSNYINEESISKTKKKR